MNLNSAAINTNVASSNIAVINAYSNTALRIRIEDKIDYPKSDRIVYLSPKQKFEKKLLEKVEFLVHRNLDNPDYKITNLARDMAYSQRQLERIIRRLTGFSPINFVREIRLLEAFRLLEEGVYQTITEVRYQVGMEHPSYFNKKFIERFGIRPKELMMN